MFVPFGAETTITARNNEVSHFEIQRERALKEAKRGMFFALVFSVVLLVTIITEILPELPN